MNLKALDLLLGLSEPSRVLIIEDNVAFAKRLATKLRSVGHTVHGFSGIQTEGDKLAGIEPHGTEEPEEIDLANYKVCFLDHYFAGDEFNGSSFLGVLGNFPIRVCGMSSVDSANEAMRRRGALTSIRKDLLDQLLTL